MTRVRIRGISTHDWKFILFYIDAVCRGDIKPNPVRSKVFSRMSSAL